MRNHDRAISNEEFTGQSRAMWEPKEREKRTFTHSSRHAPLGPHSALPDTLSLRLPSLPLDDLLT